MQGIAYGKCTLGGYFDLSILQRVIAPKRSFYLRRDTFTSPGGGRALDPCQRARACSAPLARFASTVSVYRFESLIHSPTDGIYGGYCLLRQVMVTSTSAFPFDKNRVGITTLSPWTFWYTYEYYDWTTEEGCSSAGLGLVFTKLDALPVNSAIPLYMYESKECGRTYYTWCYIHFCSVCNL